MSKQEKTAERPKFDSAELRKLWKQPTGKWIEFLNSIGAQNIKDGGDTIKLCCPFHADKNPSGIIHLAKCYYKCHACSTYVQDPIKVVARFFPAGYSEAFAQFRQHFGLSKAVDAKSVNDTELQQRRMRLLNDIFHTYLCEIWTADQMPETARKAAGWLRQRGIIDIQGIASIGAFPRLVVFEKLAKLASATDDDITWCKRLIGDYFNNAYTDCIVYTYALSPDEITAFKLRPPGPDKSQVRFVRPDNTPALGAFGVYTPAFFPFYGHDKATRFIAVEGEHDQMALFLGQYSSGQMVEPVIALGGSGHEGVDFMAELGFTECRLVGDDDAAGADYPESVFSKSRKITFQVFQWPLAIKNRAGGKIDPDEAVSMHGFDEVFKELTTAKNYAYASRWCLERAKAKMQGVHPDNIVATNDIAAEYGALLRNDIERRSFAEEFAKAFPKAFVADIIKGAAKRESTALGFMESIAEWIRSKYQVTTWDNVTCILKLWNKEKKYYLKLPVDTVMAVTMFIADSKAGNKYYWARDEIGLPAYFPDPEAEDATTATMDKVEGMIDKEVQRAFRMLASEASTDIGSLRGQGIHLANTETGQAGYIVNGNRVFRLTWKHDYSGLNAVTELEGPTDNGLVFDLEHRPNLVENMYEGWTSLFKDSQEFLQHPPYTVTQTFKLVHELIDTGFEFNNQTVDSLYCAALVFYNYIYDVIVGRRMLTHLYAQFESGKTSLLSVIANHTQMRQFALCDHAVALDTFTQAGFYQMFTNSRLVSALDEMNDYDDGSPDSHKRKEFYAKCRTLATAGHAHLSQGTQDGLGRRFNIRNTIITAAGTVIHHPMDESRFNTINLKKNVSRGNVRLVLSKKFTPDILNKLRISIFRHAVHLAPRIAQEYQYLYSYFGSKNEADAKGKTNITNVDRFTENLMPVAAILNVFGEDGSAFIDQYRDSRQQAVYERSKSTAGHAMIDALITTNFSSRDEENQVTSIKTMLLNASQRDKINVSKTGIYYDDQTRCLGIVWSEVKQNLLRNSPHRFKSAHALRSEAETASDWIFEREAATKIGVVRRLMANGMTSTNDIFTIVTVGDFILKHETAVREVAAEQAALGKNPAPAPSIEDPLKGV